MKNAVRILVIEDDAALGEVLTEVFEVAGYNCRIFNDASDLFERVADFEPQLILLDYVLPFTNGGELCIQLKANCGTKHIPVIIYSAVTKALLPVTTFGCNLFIEKPFDLDFLLAQVKRLSMSEKLTGEKI